MKKISMVVGLLCLAAGHAPSETFEEQVPQEIQKISGDVGKVQQALTASKAQAAPLPTPQGRPVPDYEDLFEAMLCHWPSPVEGVVVIRDAETLQRIAGGDCGAELPKIDFSRRTMIGLYATGGGCSIKFERTVRRDDAAKKIVLSVVVLSKGRCEKMGVSMNWVSVPVIPKDYKVAGSISQAPLP